MSNKAIKLIFICCFSCVFSNPSGEKIISGKIEIDKNKNALNIIQKSKKAIIDWNDFSISKNEITKCILPSKDSSILNRVISSNPSKILGKLESNGKVFLINQNGILVGKNATIDTFGFVASTLNIANEEFLSSKDLKFSGDSDRLIENYGQIKTSLGNVFLIGKTIKNKGEIISEGKTEITVGKEILLIDGENPKILLKAENNFIENTGSILSIETELKALGDNPYSMVINQDGIIDATGFNEKEGKIFLGAEGSVNVSGILSAKKIDIFSDEINIKSKAILNASYAKDAEITIGIDRTNNTLAKKVLIESGAKIKADTIDDKDAGKIYIGANDINCKGFISAQALEKGKPGHIEINSKNDTLIDSEMNLLSKDFGTGTVKFDLEKVSIGSSKRNNTLTDKSISSILSKANINISTNNEAIFDEYCNVIWSDPNTFNINAKNIKMNKNVVVQNKYYSPFNAIEFNAKNYNGNYSGIVIEKNCIISTDEGKIILKGNSGNTLDNNYGIRLLGVIASNADISLNGISGKGEKNNSGIYIDKGEILSQKNIYLYGVSYGTQEYNHGTIIDGKILSNNGNVIINGNASGTNSRGVFINNGKVQASEGTIDINGNESGSFGVFLSSRSLLSAKNDINITGNNSVFTEGNIDANKVNISIGKNFNGRLMIKREPNTEELFISGGKNNDIFNINCSLKGSIDGKKGENTIVLKDDNNVVNIFENNKGDIDSSLNFENIQNIIASSYMDDLFIIHSCDNNNLNVEAKGGNNTVSSLCGGNWNILGKNQVTFNDTLKFSNVQNLNGGDLDDKFIFSSSGEITGIIDGKNGNNTLDFSTCLNSRIIDLHKIKNISKIIGGKSIDTIIGPEKPSTWEIYAKNTGSSEGILFENIENIISGDQNDVFVFKENGSLDGILDGNNGFNLLQAPDNDNKWVLTGINEGYIENVVHYKNIQSLHGGIKEDIFCVNDGAKFEKIDGGEKEKSILDYSYCKDSQTIDLHKVDNVELVKGGKSDDVLIGKDDSNIWEITGHNEGKVNEVAFEDIDTLKGGKLSDVFVFTSDQSAIDGTIKGDEERVGKTILDYSSYDKNVNVNLISGKSSSTSGISEIDVAVLPNINTKQEKNIPKEHVISLYDDMNVPVVAKKPKQDKLAKISIDPKEKWIELAKRNEIQQYIAYSPYVITKKQVKNIISKYNLNVSFGNVEVADSSIRIRNNLKASINTKKMASRGKIRKSSVEYDQDDNNFDIENFDIINKSRMQSIKQRPRNLHFQK